MSAFVVNRLPERHDAYVRGSYGVAVVNDCMAPEFRRGDVALVNPHLPVTADQPYIFYSEAGPGGEGLALLARLRRAGHKNWFLTQHNPDGGKRKNFKLDRAEWPWAHRVVGSYLAR